METFEVTAEKHPGYTIVRIQGYLAPKSAQKVQDVVEDCLKQNELRFILDFTQCKLISSPGMVMILELTMRVIDDFKAKMVISGTDKLKDMVFKMAGISSLVPVVQTLEEARKRIEA